jgi:hypothetical protein
MKPDTEKQRGGLRSVGLDVFYSQKWHVSLHAVHKRSPVHVYVNGGDFMND